MRVVLLTGRLQPRAVQEWRRVSNHSVELFVGPYRSGKTLLLLDELIAFKREQPLASTLILVPSARYGKLLKERIAAALCKESGFGNIGASDSRNQARRAGKPAGIFGLQILPFYQCCLQVLSKTSAEPLVIPEQLRPGLLSKILAELKFSGRIKALSKVANFHGTSFAMLELIDELQRAGLSPDDVLARLEQSSCQESHLIELAMVYQEYWNALKSLGYYDQKSLALAAREQLFSNQGKDHDLLLIEGFDRVSHLQAQIFAGLSQHAELTKISFDYWAQPEETIADLQKAENALQQSADEYLWKKNSFDELCSNLNPNIIQVINGARTASVTTETSDAASPQLEIISLLDPFLEMVEVARQVKLSIAERKIDHSDIIVVTREPDSYNGAIETAFEDAGINYFIDGSRKIVELEPWRFIRNFLLLKENELRRKGLLDLLRSPYMNLEALSMTARDVSILDRDSYEIGLIGGLKTWSTFLQKKQFGTFAKALIEFLNSIQHVDEDQASAATHARRIEDIIERYMLFPASEADIRSAAAGQEREAVKALRRALKVLMMEEQLLEHKAETFKQFFNKVESLIEKTNFARPRPQQAAVTICSAELVPNKPFKEVFICGVNEGDFPRHQRSSGFLSNDETQLWLSFGIDIRNPRHEPGFEKALFYSLTERAKNRLTLCLTQFGNKGEETIPSFYLSEIQEKLKINCAGLSPFQRSETRPISARDALSMVLWRKGISTAETLAERSLTIEKQLHSLKLSFSASMSRANGDYRNLFNGYLSDFFEIGALSMVANSSWTASKLNDYGKCPFRYWASHVLDIEPREEAEAGLNFKFIGMFYHKVLELFFSARAKQSDPKNGRPVESPQPDRPLGETASRSLIPDLTPDEIAGAPMPLTRWLSPTGPHRPCVAREETSDSTQELFERSFARGIQWLEARSDFQAGPYWEQEKKDLRFRLIRFIERELERINDEFGIQYAPAMFEANFGTKAENSYPPLKIAGLDGKPILVSGTIDRVDLEVGASSGKRKARVLDYKSSSRSISSKEAERGRNLQLPIYALALENSIMPEATVTEAHYLSINAARPVGHLDFESDKNAHLKNHTSELISNYVNDAQHGVFLVKPNGNDVCKDCIHSSVCRVAELKGQIKEEERDASFN